MQVVHDSISSLEIRHTLYRCTDIHSHMSKKVFFSSKKKQNMIEHLLWGAIFRKSVGLIIFNNKLTSIFNLSTHHQKKQLRVQRFSPKLHLWFHSKATNKEGEMCRLRSFPWEHPFVWPIELIDIEISWREILETSCKSPYFSLIESYLIIFFKSQLIF